MTHHILPSFSISSSDNTNFYHPSPTARLSNDATMMATMTVTSLDNCHLPPIMRPTFIRPDPVPTRSLSDIQPSQSEVYYGDTDLDARPSWQGGRKRSSHHEAIIVKAKVEEDAYMDDVSLPAAYHTPPRQLVSPEAVRCAEMEEREEGEAFAGYPSFLSMKNFHKHHRPKTGLTDIESPALSSLSSPSGSPAASPSLPNAIFSALPPTALPTSLHPLQPAPLVDPTNWYPLLSSSSTPTLTSRDPVPQKDILYNPIDLSPSLAPSACQTQSPSSPQPQQERLKRPPNAYLLFNREMRGKLLAFDPKMTVAQISKEIGDRWKHLPPDERHKYQEAAHALKQDHLKNHPDFIYTRRSKAQLEEARRLSRSHRKASMHTSTNERVSLVYDTTLIPTNNAHDPLLPPSIPVSIPRHSQSLPLVDATMTHQPSPSTSSPSIATFTPSLPPPTPTAPPKKRRGRQKSADVQRDPRGRKKKRNKYPTGPKHPMSGFLFFLGAIRPQVAQQFPGSTVGPISKEISSRWKSMTDEQRAPWLQKAADDKARYAREIQAYLASRKKEEEQPAASLPVNHDHHQLTPHVTHPLHGESSHSPFPSTFAAPLYENPLPPM
ncbi:hypothetical protein DM01DRAFT_1321099 [Hesseltinella vesiculosa]|uniref:HMG box domain-containing protein n=1 Tax=Hesseltinella vesiculosa TaxID=101127 RepID=A0A1X2GKE8_9FUNG|nr:hypothetical protein DM01DRAFT_1321099 [Hesseltinella vesiculosa]